MRAAIAAAARPWYLQAHGASFERAVVGHAQRQAEQAHDGTHQTLGLAPRQTDTARKPSAVSIARGKCQA
jgi:hypothetical protein